MPRTTWALLVLMGAACAPVPPPYAPPPHAGPPPYAPPPHHHPPMGQLDQCGAGAHQWLVGRDRSEIPPRPPGANWRIACTTCPVTMDYSPQRMNIFYDARSGRVREVRCG